MKKGRKGGGTWWGEVEAKQLKRKRRGATAEEWTAEEGERQAREGWREERKIERDHVTCLI